VVMREKLYSSGLTDDKTCLGEERKLKMDHQDGMGSNLQNGKESAGGPTNSKAVGGF